MCTYRTREELDAARKELEKRKRALMERKEAEKSLPKRIGELEELVESLRNEKMHLEEQCDALQKDNDRVYAGHRGLEEEINFLKYRISTLDELHESVIQGTGVHDGSLKQYKCMYPFERIELLPRGEVYTCCSGYLKHNYYIGNFFEQSFEEIWNSERALKLRYSVSNGNFEYCMENCKWLHKENIEDAANASPIVERIEEDHKGNWEECYVETFPKYVNLTCDESCNLTCPTCRSAIKALDKEEAERLYDRLELVVKPMLKDCELLGALGSGDIFASYALTKFYKTFTSEEFPKLKLYIMTNLQLLTEEKWNEMSNLHTIPIRMAISVDAADKETYEKNRRGGGWEILRSNMSFIREWRKRVDNKIELLGLNFVVQENNFRQMEEFVKFAEEYDADVVEFQQLGNWGTFSDEEFRQRNVFDSHNDLYEEACQRLRAVMAQEWNVKIIQNIL